MSKKEMQIISENKSNKDLCISALSLIQEKTPEIYNIFNSVDKIIIGDHQEGDAVASAFSDERVIVLTPKENTSIEELSSILVHEGSHIYHYSINPEEYMDQLKAEEYAFKNEIDFLEKIDNKDLIKKAEEVRDSFLKFLKENKGTDFVGEDVLKEGEMNMGNHERLLREFEF